MRAPAGLWVWGVWAVDSSYHVQPHLTLLFPLPQGWTKLCRQSAGPRSLLPPPATTAEGPQGHEMSATGRVRYQSGREVFDAMVCGIDGAEMDEWARVCSSCVRVRRGHSKSECAALRVTPG